MRYFILTIIGLLFVTTSFSQNRDSVKFKLFDKAKSYYYGTIMKGINQEDSALKTKKPVKIMLMDQSSYKLPDKVNLYEKVWANPPISQGNTGTCWDFSTTSFLESEIQRITGKKVKLSEMYIAYHEYIEKAKRYIEERGNSNFSEGSEANAVTRMAEKYGLMPESVYNGLLNGKTFYDHHEMFSEMNNYLESMKATKGWNTKAGIETIMEIMNHYMGVPPTTFTVNSKKYTPLSYMKDYLKFNPSDYVDIISYKQMPFWQKGEYKVPDNWWHSEDYYNIPLKEFMSTLKKSIKNGYSISIGGDVSEPGFSRETQCAMIPDYDIPSKWINDDSRAFRFENKTTGDDHGLHLIGYLENYKGTGEDWYLIKDSGSGSRDNGVKKPEFGYYFFSSDYIKLKIMDFTIHKDAVKDILKKIKEK